MTAAPWCCRLPLPAEPSATVAPLVAAHRRCYYQNTNAVIYVVDSADPDRMGISKQEL